MPEFLKPQSPLKHKDGAFFYPLTTEDQVIMEDGSRLSGANFLSFDDNSIAGEANPINADTLGGKPAAAYATESFVNNKISEVGSSKPDLVLRLNPTDDYYMLDNLRTTQIKNGISIKSGSIADVVAKIKNQQEVKVLLEYEYEYDGYIFIGTYYPSNIGVFKLNDSLNLEFIIAEAPGFSGWYPIWLASMRIQQDGTFINFDMWKLQLENRSI